MKILNLIQGTKEWKGARLTSFTASEATIMMGASPHMSRDDLLTYKTTQVEEEIGRFQQLIFDKGHDLEAMARPIAERKLGEELYPVTGALEVEGLPLLASFDGLDMMEEVGFEHKQWNAEKARWIEENSDLKPEHYWQLEQQLLVADASGICFVMSDGTENNWVELNYISVPSRRAALIAGWKQFQIDLNGYEPVAYQEKPEAAPVVALPAILYKLNGVALTSNLDAFKLAADELVERSQEPMESDQDFVDREALIKVFKDTEGKIKHMQQAVVGEITDIDQFVKDLGYISEGIRQARLNGEKQVKSRKEEIRVKIVKEATAKFADHIAELNSRLAGVVMPVTPVDFVGAIKGKKNVKSLNEAANDELARGKIEANQVHQSVKNNMAIYFHLASDFEFLFPNLQDLITHEAVAFEALIKTRIADHQAEQLEKDKQQQVSSAQTAPIAESQAAPSTSNQGPESTAPAAHKNRSMPEQYSVVCSEYQRGYIDSLKAYSWEANGELVVGPEAISLDSAIEHFQRKEAEKVA